MNDNLCMDRRTAMLQMSGLAIAGLTPRVRAAEAVQRTSMGLVVYDCRFRREWLRKQNPQFDLFEPLTFLQHCHTLGAGGMQAELGVLDADPIRHLRDYAENHALFIDAIVAPPKDKSDLTRFEAEIKTAKDVGVQAVRTVIMPGRRYERFTSLADFREFAERGKRMLELATPIVERHRVPLAVENHKDQRNEERVALFQHLDSEFVGACVDTGNSFALLEDPLETVEVLAPWAKTVHLKDQALQEYEQGFLLGDIPLGQGCFDLQRMVEILRRAKPGIRFALELITRDALKVPCLTEKYFVSLPAIPASDLSRTLRFVRQCSVQALQQVSSQPPEQQVALEDANIAASLAYARRELGLHSTIQ